jgi:hypothetical protein
VHRVIEEIYESNRWRDSDFAKFKVNPGDVEHNLWNRMCIPMIYAHWEGSIVSSLRILVTYLNELNLEPSTVKTNLIVFGLDSSYKSLSGKQSFEQRVTFTDKFNSTLKKSLIFPKKIDTRSNLNSAVLREICMIFLLNQERFIKYDRDIDKLVQFRNAIAHGENSINPTSENIEFFINLVTKALDELIDELTIFVNTKVYLRADIVTR